MRLVLLGVSGAGKGTQAKNLCKHYHIAHISTGDILRDHMSKKTQIGLEIQHIMDTGKLVPSAIVIELVKERLKEEDCKNGYILDGFPRTLYQVQTLEDFAEIDRAIYVQVEDQVVIERLTGRYVCPACAAMYHMKHVPPKHDTECDNCQTKLIQREDDKAETVIERLRIFHELTEPIISFYETRGTLFTVSGDGEVNAITAAIVKELGE